MPDPESEIIEEQVGDCCEKLSTDCDLRERNLYDRITGIKWSIFFSINLSEFRKFSRKPFFWNVLGRNLRMKKEKNDHKIFRLQ